MREVMNPLRIKSVRKARIWRSAEDGWESEMNPHLLELALNKPSKYKQAEGQGETHRRTESRRVISKPLMNFHLSVQYIKMSPHSMARKASLSR